MFKPREQPEVVNTSAKTTGYDRWLTSVHFSVFRSLHRPTTIRQVYWRTTFMKVSS